VMWRVFHRCSIW